MIKTLLIFVFLLLFPSVLQAQDTLVYDFISVDDEIRFEFSYLRIYKQDGSFEERGLFSKDDVQLFKIKKGNWYIKEKKQWKLFYSSKKTISPKIKLFGLDFLLEPLKKDTLNGLQCVVYEAKPLHPNTSVSVDLTYWFNPENGFVKLETNGGSLYRKDFVDH